MKAKRSLIIGIILILIFILSISSSVFAFGSNNKDYIFPEVVVLEKTPVIHSLVIYNSTPRAQTYTIKPYTGPFPVSFSSQTLTLAPYTSNIRDPVQITFQPLEHQLESLYNASFKISTETETRLFNFNIHQKTNRFCPLELEVDTQFENNTLSFNFVVSNPTPDSYYFDFLEFSDFDDFNKISLLVRNDQNIQTLISFEDVDYDIEETTLIYRCNNLEKRFKISIPERVISESEEEIVNGEEEDENENEEKDGEEGVDEEEVIEDEEETEDEENNNTIFINSNLSGFLGLINYNFAFMFLNAFTTTKLLPYFKSFSFLTIFDSVAFQIFLIFVLVILILTFTTRYIKYLYNSRR